MTKHDSNSGKRERLGFAEAVSEYISPVLADRGFTCIEATPYSVKFQSPNVALTVFHDLISYEIDVVYARQADPSQRYDLRNMLDAAGSKEPIFFQASTYDRIIEAMKTIADLLRKYGGDVLAGNLASFQRIGETAQDRNAAYTKEVVQKPIRKAAEDAWQKRDYAKVRDLYGPIEADLTAVEKKRLDYARSHSTRT